MILCDMQKGVAEKNGTCGIIWTKEVRLEMRNCDDWVMPDMHLDMLVEWLR
jgi:hypothetical protein